jgi:hypothetical protein
MGFFTLGLHLVKVISTLLLFLSLAAGFDHLFAAGLLPQDTLAYTLGNPLYFATAVGCYMTLGIIALFTIVPLAERSYVAPIVPLYLLYTLIHVIPMSIGFTNWLTMKLWGRRVYRDHYEPGGESRDALPEAGCDSVLTPQEDTRRAG